MKRLKYLLGSLLAAVILFGHGAVYALDIPPAPTDTSVVDQTSTLNPAQISEISATIAAEEEKSGNEIAVLMIPTLKGDSLEDYSIKVARGWGVGQKSNNNGVLLLVVKDDRKLRIEVGYGLEGALTDAQSGQIIRDDITPSFKRENYYAGIRNGVNAIISSIHNEYVASPSNSTNLDDVEDPIGLLLLLLYIGLGAFSWIVAVLARSKTWWAGGIFGFIIATAATIPISATATRIVVVGLISLLGLGFDYAVSKNFKQRKASGDKPSWWAGGTTFGGGFGGGSGGSGGGGFGGGSFGGGGSSGSW